MTALAQLVLAEEAVAIAVRTVEARLRSGQRLGLADPAVALRIHLPPQDGAPRLRTRGAQLRTSDLAVAVRVDRIETLGEARQRLRLGAADHAVAVGIGRLEPFETRALPLREHIAAGNDRCR